MGLRPVTTKANGPLEFAKASPLNCRAGGILPAVLDTASLIMPDRPRTRRLLSRVLAISALYWPFAAAAQCPPTGWDEAALAKLREATFDGLADDRRDRLALGLLDCLADPDPDLRDASAYSGLSHWLRAGQLSAELRAELIEEVLAKLTGNDDEGGFGRSFAALVLSELVRADRIDPQLSAAQRAQVRQATIDWYQQINDYRAFDPAAGWRHAVAHGADLILQQAVHPATDAEALAALMQALASQIAPAGDYGFRHSESERQARAAFYAYQRELLDETWWSEWLAALTEPTPATGPWSAAFDSAEGLARRHNTLGFLHEIAFAARFNPGERNDTLAARADQAMRVVKDG